jgi:hypothetical protein
MAGMTYRERRLGSRRSGAIMRHWSSSPSTYHPPCIVDSILNRPALFSFPQPTVAVPLAPSASPDGSVYRLIALALVHTTTNRDRAWMCQRYKFAGYF